MSTSSVETLWNTLQKINTCDAVNIHLSTKLVHETMMQQCKQQLDETRDVRFGTYGCQANNTSRDLTGE